jgi:hypothetical protein
MRRSGSRTVISLVPNGCSRMAYIDNLRPRLVRDLEHGMSFGLLGCRNLRDEKIGTVAAPKLTRIVIGLEVKGEAECLEEFGRPGPSYGLSGTAPVPSDFVSLLLFR